MLSCGTQKSPQSLSTMRKFEFHKMYLSSIQIFFKLSSTTILNCNGTVSKQNLTTKVFHLHVPRSITPTLTRQMLARNTKHLPRDIISLQKYRKETYLQFLSIIKIRHRITITITIQSFPNFMGSALWILIFQVLIFRATSDIIRSFAISCLITSIPVMLDFSLLSLPPSNKPKYLCLPVSSDLCCAFLYHFALNLCNSYNYNIFISYLFYFFATHPS